MKTFLARQPIIDLDGESVGYELLFRRSTDNQAKIEDDYQATMEVIKNLIVNFGIKEITNDKRAFVNFNEDLIKDGGAEFFKPEKLVIELENLDLDDEVMMIHVEECKAKGYLLAGDSITSVGEDTRFIEAMDMLKIDLSKLTKEALKRLVLKLKPFNKVLIAEKVEDVQSYEFAKSLGITMFQGYYFQKPVVMESSEATSIPAVYYQLLNVLNHDEINYGLLAETIKQDSAMTLSLLKLINSAVYHSNSKITSIKDALVRLGEKESRRVLMINMLKSIALKDTVGELINMSLRRGRQAEKLAPYYGLQHRRDELFLVGLLSLINIIARKPMPAVLTDVPLQADVIDALLGEANSLSEVMETIILFEMEDYSKVASQLKTRKCTIDIFNEIYSEAIHWSDSVIR